ncbi:adenylyltransferase/cytidyltransferase family protein [Deinococcus aquatilis]|jgi:bifunctional NMN adenylyltransferase/nudix hydrolase|uniref:adenylyltransferase/cytidyltransferase family protein n=1 Tax=Deinococcus aquatilis TaxID=519440 RepID=UPI00035E0AA8|nr:adenylyltransferase/cytidyltransferase family protein [Deinococcus aquatilis]
MSANPPPAVFVGRFQPPHTAHVATIVQALGAAPRVLVLLGSANLARSIRNPFSAPERAQMLRAALGEAGVGTRQVRFRALPDRFDADLWAADVRWQAEQEFGPARPVALVGFEKDASTAYLRWFPGWSRLPVPEVAGLNATDIRAALFEGWPLPTGVPDPVRTFLTRFALTPAFARLRAEWQAVRQLRATLPAGLLLHEERWLHLIRTCSDSRTSGKAPDVRPSPPARTFCYSLCSDDSHESSQFGITNQHVWLRTRTEATGRGLWELPGRVLLPGQLPHAVADAVFDHPARSLVGPTAAHVYRGPPPPGVPEAALRPVPLETALGRPRRFFEDHQVILRQMVVP